jgi:DNA-binding NarL/FixJ family response regulator
MLVNENSSADGNGALHDRSTLWSQTIRLIILDRRAFLRECIASCLRMLPRKIEILCGAGGAEELRADELAQADVVMLCASPAFNETVQHEITSLLFNCPDLPIVLIADSRNADEAKYLVARWRLRGYIPTSSSLAAAEAALDVVLAGGTYLPPDWTDDARDATCAADASNMIGGAKLTTRERAVLSFLREGMPNKLIAHRLGIAQSTVKAHIHSILTKLRSHNRTEAAVQAAGRFLAALPSDEAVKRPAAPRS